ncbi:ComF family protein [Aquimarina sp. W85]|uniref:ComF family protein n=1 Tax=Aquimarina rhodophyticola TaxID=3342246 RepID=UPI00366F73EE
MLRDLAYLFYPKHCAACDNYLDRNEDVLCTSCRYHLPQGNFHLINAKNIEKVFYDSVKIENFISLLIFEKEGLVQNLIHNLKYRGQKKIGAILGAWLASKMLSTEQFNDLDVVIPVPLHKKRLKERGYNQVEEFGKKIAQSLHITYEDAVLIKKSYTVKQSKQKRIMRWQNSTASFSIQNETRLTGKHILLVDDIITTGATLQACIDELKNIEGIKLSIATMAITE